MESASNEKELFLRDPRKFLTLDWDRVAEGIRQWLRERVPKNAVVGLSGGVDSSLVAHLAASALGAGRVHGMILPSRSNESRDEQLAAEVADELGISRETIPIEPIVEAFRGAMPGASEFAINNAKPRIRMALLYAHANDHDALVLGTGNKSELMVGYFTKWGDGGVDLEPIGDLFKFQVWGLARHVGVPAEVVERPPTAGLWPGQTDEEEMGLTYWKLDKILCGLELGCTPAELVAHCGVTEEEVVKVRRMVEASKHKRFLPPTCPF
ncbi:MAG: NAD+ synthase [Promethearchaeota archaeon]